ncbi:hypothetical protein ACS0TY_033776 [Phlomoides rotata]
MKIVSINARGIYSNRKKKAIKDFITEFNPDIVCNQETKSEVITRIKCESIWPNRDFDWVYSGSCGASGGILIIWNCLRFSKTNFRDTSGALMVTGDWGPEVCSINIVSVYAPCASIEKKKLWYEISNWISEHPEGLWCVCSDFNAIIHKSERKGRNHKVNSTNIRHFCSFINNYKLVDLPLLR